MSIATADNFKATNPKPFSEWDLYPNGDSTYRQWASTSEVTSYFSGPNMSPSWAKYKFFWIAGVYHFYTGNEFIPIGAPGNVKGIAYTNTVPAAGATIDAQYIYFSGPGTFANFPGADSNPIVLTENLNIISWDGTKATVQAVPVNVDLSGYAQSGGSDKTLKEVESAKENTITSWKAEPYIVGTKVVKDGILYEAFSDLVEDDIPGISANWKPVLFVTKDISQGVNNNGVWRSDTGANANLSGSGFPNQQKCNPLVDVKPGDYVRYSGFTGSSSGIAGYKEDGTYLTGNGRILDSTANSIYGDGVTEHWLDFIFKVPDGIFKLGPSTKDRTTDPLKIEIITDLNAYVDDVNAKSDQNTKNIEALATVTKEGKNLIDKSKIAYGFWNASGAFSSSTASISTPKIPIDATKGPLSLNKNSNFNNPEKVIFWDEDGNFISSVLKTDNLQGFEIPQETEDHKAAAFLAINIVSVAGGVGDATNNTYVNDLQLEYGAESSSFESYGKKIKPSALPIGSGSPAIVISYVSATNFNVKVLHPTRGDYITHSFVRTLSHNTVGSYSNVLTSDVWWTNNIIANGNTIAQGNLNFIYQMDDSVFPNENQHVGAGHGCVVQKWTKFFADGQLFDPSQPFDDINCDSFSMRYFADCYAVDATATISSDNVLPQLDGSGNPIVANQHLIDAIFHNGEIRHRNRLIIRRDNTQFYQLFAAMNSCYRPYFDMVSFMGQNEYTLNKQVVEDGIVVVTPINCLVNTGNSSGRSQWGNEVTQFSENGNYSLMSKIINMDNGLQSKCNLYFYYSTAPNWLKVYLQPCLTASSGLGIPDIFNAGDIIDIECIRKVA